MGPGAAEKIVSDFALDGQAYLFVLAAYDPMRRVRRF
jgi:hypothetical protein